MSPEMQNAGDELAGASRNQLGRWLHVFPTASERRAQMLAERFSLSPWLAQDVANLCSAEGGHE